MHQLRVHHGWENNGVHSFEGHWRRISNHSSQLLGDRSYMANQRNSSLGEQNLRNPRFQDRRRAFSLKGLSTGIGAC